MSVKNKYMWAYACMCVRKCVIIKVRRYSTNSSGGSRISQMGGTPDFGDINLLLDKKEIGTGACP